MAINIARRKFISALGGTAFAWPFAARAQRSLNKIPVVGVLWHAGSAEEEDVYLSILRKAFNDLGYTERKNIHWRSSLDWQRDTTVLRPSAEWPAQDISRPNVQYLTSGSGRAHRSDSQAVLSIL
jgi:hypothetical protein